MLTKPHSSLLQKKASMLPIPGTGGVGGIDVADMDSLASHGLDSPADPANNYTPLYGKGSETDSLKQAWWRGRSKNYKPWNPKGWSTQQLAEGMESRKKRIAEANIERDEEFTKYVPITDRPSDYWEQMDYDSANRMGRGILHDDVRGRRFRDLDKEIARLKREMRSIEIEQGRQAKSPLQQPTTASLKLADNSICRCGHQWHEHWSLGNFGCKDTSCECKGFKAKTGSVNSLLHPKRADLSDIWATGSEGLGDKEDFRAGLKQEWDDPDGYLYRSEVYCPRCGRELIDELIDTKQIGPSAPDENDEWTKDSDIVPQPILSLEPGMERCGKCGDDARPETREPGELNDQDKDFLKDMKISLASLKGLSKRVASDSPLLQPPDPSSATFFKESENDGWEDPEYNKEWLKGVRAKKKPRCPHCGSDDYALMPTDFETAKCNKCEKTWDHGIVPGINDPSEGKTAANPNHTVRDFNRKNPNRWKELRESQGVPERPLQPFTQWLIEEAGKGKRYNTIEEARAVYDTLPAEGKTASDWNTEDPSKMDPALAAHLRSKGMNPWMAPTTRLPDAEMKKFPITKEILAWEKETGRRMDSGQASLLLPRTAADAGPEGFPPPQRELDYDGWSTIGTLRKRMTELYNAWRNKEITREEYEVENYLLNVAREAAKKAWTDDPKYRELTKAIDSSEGRNDTDFLKSMGVTSAKNASEKSYGMGTPLGGASSVPAPNNTQEKSQDPLQTPQSPWQPPDTAKANTAPEQATDQMADEVVKKLQDKMGNVELSQIVRTDEGEEKPGRSDIKRHIDKSLLDKDYSPPRPLSKGAGIADEAEYDEEPYDPEAYNANAFLRADESVEDLPTIRQIEETNKAPAELECNTCKLKSSQMNDGKATNYELAIWLMRQHLHDKHQAKFGPHSFTNLTSVERNLTPSSEDKDFLKGMGIKEAGRYHGYGEDEGDDEEVTDLGTKYGQPIGGKPKPEYRCPICGWSGEGSMLNHMQAYHPGSTPSIDIDETLSDVKMGPEDHCPICGLNWVGWGQSYKDDHTEGHLAKKEAPPSSKPPRFRPTKDDKDFLKGMGIKGSKTAADAEAWWRSTVNTKRRELAGALGIDKYWSHFVWESLPPEIQEKVKASLPQATEPQLELNPEDRELLGGMKIQAAGKKWNPILAKEFYDKGLASAMDGNWNEAANALSQSLNHNPYNGPAHFMLGIVFAQDGDTAAALSQFKDSLRTSPKEDYPYHGIITELSRKGELDGLPQDVKNYLLDNMVAKTAAGSKVAKGLGAPIKERTAAEGETWWRSCKTCGKPALELKKGENVRCKDVYCDECSGKNTAVQVEDGVNLVCPNCKGQKCRPVDDPDAEGGNLVECEGCGAFFAA